MKRHMFLSYRSEPLPRWREAFPEAEVLPQATPGKRFTLQAGQTLIWLHLNPEAEAAAQFRDAALAAPGTPIVVLSNVPSEDEGLLMLSGGAVGYCHALAVPEMLRQVAQVVENGGLWVGPELTQRLVRALAASSAQAPCVQLANLSPREREVALAVAHGASNKEIARNLDISERTVKAHLSAVFEKLGVRDRLQLSLLINGAPSGAGQKAVH